jgi:hypothetical protein
VLILNQFDLCLFGGPKAGQQLLFKHAGLLLAIFLDEALQKIKKFFFFFLAFLPILLDHCREVVFSFSFVIAFNEICALEVEKLLLRLGELLKEELKFLLRLQNARHV